MWSRMSTSRKEVPDFYQQYLQRWSGKPDPNTPVSELRFVVLDTETTGLHVQKDRLLSIGALRVSGNKIHVADRLECLIHQSYTPTGEATAIHGILPADRPDSLHEATALRDLLAFLGTDIVVGHHVAFDRRILEKGYQALIPGFRWNNDFLDTQHLARRVFARGPYQPKPTWSLDRLGEKLGVPVHQRHTAGGDAFVTALILLKLLARLADRGVTTRRRLL